MVRTISRRTGDCINEKDTPWYASLRGLTCSDIHPVALLREAGWICWDYYTTNRAKRKAADPKACRFNAFREKNRTQLMLLYHTPSILSIIFSLLPIDVRQYGTRAAISTWHSWSTYRNRAIFRSYLPSGARFITAFICSALSPCNAGGKTMRAAATGSTEPKRLRQLSSVAHHIAKHRNMVTCTNDCSSAVRICLDNTFWASPRVKWLVCSACHDILL